VNNMQENVATAAEALNYRPTLAAEDALRANTYSLLATLLAAPPSLAVLDLIGRIDDVPQDGASPIVKAWQVLKLAASRASPAALDDEYHALFIGVSRGEVVPYGSYYTTGFLTDKPLALLRRDLDALGFERQADVREPEDHAAALCEVMSLIIAGDDEIPVATQRRFFEDHVGGWMGQLFADLQRSDSARFYGAVGDLGEQFMRLERTYLTMMG
jgi:TorA maturation chaperone TorD